MIFAHTRRTLVCFFSKNSLFPCKSQSNVSFTLSLHCFSTSGKTEKLPPISPTVSELLLQKHQFSPEVASQIASALADVKDPEKSDSILTFFKESGFSNPQLEKILKYRPRLLFASLEKSIKPKIKIFQDLGFSANDVAAIFTGVPSILHRSAVNSIIPSLTMLNGLLGSTVEVAKLLKVCGWFLTKDLEKTMVPNIEFLKNCFIPKEHIINFLCVYPRCILLKPENLRRCVRKADEMGVNRRFKMYIHALGVIGSLSEESWELKLQAFRDVGFSENDILTVFRKAPQVFSVSAEKMKRINEILLATGKYDKSCIVCYPKSLMGSIEKRYQPRLQVLRILEEKNLIKAWPSLGIVYQTPDEKFILKYVAPYLDEIGDVCIGKYVICGKKKEKVELNTSA